MVFRLDDDGAPETKVVFVFWNVRKIDRYRHDRTRPGDGGELRRSRKKVHTPTTTPRVPYRENTSRAVRRIPVCFNDSKKKNDIRFGRRAPLKRPRLLNSTFSDLVRFREFRSPRPPENLIKTYTRPRARARARGPGATARGPFSSGVKRRHDAWGGRWAKKTNYYKHPEGLAGRRTDGRAGRRRSVKLRDPRRDEIVK